MRVLTPQRARPRTKQALVYQTLREGIMHCDLAPGERLVIDEIARRFDVSAIPVREALHALTSERLVINVPHVGATVAPITRESIIDVFTLLEGLGGMALRLVAERARPAEIERLDQIIHDMDIALGAERQEQWASLNTTFHLSMAAMPGLPMLLEMTERVLDSWHRVRRYYFRGVLAQRTDLAQSEHRQMLMAVRRKDFDRLAALAHTHNRGALESYLQYLGSVGEPATPTEPASVPQPEIPR
jgi:DNA-binding GntR family transcriptional regulator